MKTIIDLQQPAILFRLAAVKPGEIVPITTVPAGCSVSVHLTPTLGSLLVIDDHQDAPTLTIDIGDPADS